MGTEFWWFYDVIAIAAVLICIFISGKKGAIKSIVNLGGYCLVLVIAFSLSGGLSERLYKDNVRSTTIRRIEKHLSENWLPEKAKNYIDSLDYVSSPKTDRLKDIYSSDKDYNKEIYTYLNNINAQKVDEEAAFTRKMNEGYALMIKELVGSELNKFTAENAAEEVRKDIDAFYELIPLLQDEDNPKPAATRITDDYISSSYVSTLRLMIFVISFAILLVIWLLAARIFMGSTNEEGVLSNILGGVLGLIKGGILIVVIAAAVRLYVVMGNDEMLFFNFDAIDKTIIFKHFYDIVLKM